jgi:hypothetical protein
MLSPGVTDHIEQRLAGDLDQRVLRAGGHRPSMSEDPQLDLETAAGRDVLDDVAQRLREFDLPVSDVPEAHLADLVHRRARKPWAASTRSSTTGGVVGCRRHHAKFTPIVSSCCATVSCSSRAMRLRSSQTSRRRPARSRRRSGPRGSEPCRSSSAARRSFSWHCQALYRATPAWLANVTRIDTSVGATSIPLGKPTASIPAGLPAPISGPSRGRRTRRSRRRGRKPEPSRHRGTRRRRPSPPSGRRTDGPRPRRPRHIPPPVEPAGRRAPRRSARGSRSCAPPERAGAMSRHDPRRPAPVTVTMHYTFHRRENACVIPYETTLSNPLPDLSGCYLPGRSVWG